MIVRVRRPNAAPFTAVSVGQNMEEGRRQAGWTATRVSEYLGWQRTYYYAKKKGRPALKLWEMAELAAAWKAPPGWPLISWAEAELRQHALDTYRRSESSAQGP